MHERVEFMLPLQGSIMLLPPLDSRASQPGLRISRPVGAQCAQVGCGVQVVIIGIICSPSPNLLYRSLLPLSPRCASARWRPLPSFRGRGREHGYWAGCGFLAPLTPVLPECSFLASSLSLLNRHTSWQMCYFCITRTI